MTNQRKVLSFIKNEGIVDSLKTPAWILNESKFLIWLNHVEVISCLILNLAWLYAYYFDLFRAANNMILWFSAYQYFWQSQDLPKFVNNFWNHILKIVTS